MKKTKIIQFFQKNWAAKLLCVIAALSLWLFVASTANKIAKFPGTIAIDPINVPANLVAVTDIKQVSIKIMADPSIWAKLTPESFSATIDLAGLKEGTHQLPVNVASAVSGVQIVEQDPSYLFVTLEPVISKTVTILKRVEGAAADGMVPGSITFSPDKLQIRGAESQLAKINDVVATITLAGEGENFTRVVEPIAYDDKNKELTGIEILPNAVQANISIVRGSNVKTVGVQVKIKGVVKEGYYISNITTVPGAVDINGVRDAVVGTKFIETVPVDVAGSSQSVMKDVALVLPDGVGLLNNTTGTIQISITISPVQAPKDFVVTNFQTTSPKYTISGYDPASVKVSVTAPLTVLAGLSASDFAVNLDLSQLVPDANGDFTVTIGKNNIETIDAVTVVGVEPVTLRVKTR